MELYRYKKTLVDNSSYTMSSPTKINGLIRYDLSFPSPVNTAIKNNDTVHAQIFQKQNDASVQLESAGDILILIHGFAAKEKGLDSYHTFIASMAKRGITIIFINLPYHLKRTPQGESSGQKLIAFNDIQTLEFFHQAVVDIRRLLDISEKIFDHPNIYLCGVSMGCMVSNIVLAFEGRINSAALLLGGGNWEEVHWKGTLRYVLNGDCSKDSINKKRVECRETYKDFPHFLEELKKTNKNSLSTELDDLKDLKEVTPKSCFLCDPMAFGHMVNPDRVLMINSRFDLYFSRRSSKYLWKELGKPQIKWVNIFHSSKILEKKKIINLVYDFFKG